MHQPGVLIVRDDGVIVVPGAAPLSPQWIAAVDRLADSLNAPPRRPDDRGTDRTDVRE